MSSGFGQFKNHVTTLENTAARILQGVFFSGTADEAALANGADLDLLIQVGTFPINLFLALVNGGDAAVQLSEGATFSAEGTPIVAQNQNRTSSVTPLTTLHKGPTITGVGTILANGRILGGTGGNASGGSADTDDVWILAPSTVYLVRLTNNSCQAQAADIHAGFWEDVGPRP